MEKNKLNKHYKEIISLIFIIIIYSISNFILLINNGRYWDDWAGYNSNFEELLQFADKLGPTYHVYWQYFLNQLTPYPALLFHWITFFLGIVNIIVFYKIMKYFIGHNKYFCFVITLLFATIPYNSAKIVMACFSYSLGLTFFLLAVLIFINYIRLKNLLFRIMSLLFFFLSFAFLNSTLVMMPTFLLFFVIFYYKDNIETNKNFTMLKLYYSINKINIYKIIFIKIFVWVDFIALPIIFWLIRKIFFYPKGIYSAIGYNNPSIVRIIKFPFDLIDVIINNVLSLLVQNFKLNNGIEITLLILFFLFIFSVMVILFKNENIVFFSNDIVYLMIVGIYFFSASVFPYLAVGIKPYFDRGEFASRHQILLVFGASFLVLSIILLVAKQKKIQIIIVSFVVTIFMITSIKQQMLYNYSWLKQESIESHFREIPEILKFHYFSILDNTSSYNETKLPYDLNVYTGIYKKINDTQDKYFSDISNYGQHWGMFKAYPEHKAVFNCKNLKRIKKPEYYLIIEKCVGIPPEDVFYYIYQYYFNRINFNKIIKPFLKIKLVKIV